MTAPDITQIPMSSDLAATLARGAEFAGATGSTEVSLEHLLAALCDDPDAVAVLDASHISGERIKADVISRVLEGAQQSASPQDSLGVSVEVRRILEAAAAAARGSRRRDINGAIVLAAIVGDARSFAAEILETHGLTFENAIRALQTALQPPREVPQPPPPQAPPAVADDVLARARERVQSRSTPSLRDIMKDMPRPAGSPEASVPLPETPAAHAQIPEPPFPEVPSYGEPTEPNAPEFEPEFESELDHEPIGPPPQAALEHEPQTERPQMEPPRPEPRPSSAAGEPMPGPARPYPAPPRSSEPRSPVGGELNPQRRSEPTFGTPGPEAGPRPTPGPSPAPPPPGFQREPSLPLPPRASPQSGPGGNRQEPHGFPSQFGPAGGPQQAPTGTGPNRGPAPPPPREMFDLPPRPQPSRVQPPPIPPAPGLGGPGAPPRSLSPGPAQSGAPQFGPPSPGMSPSGPPGAQSRGGPGGVPAPAPHPNLGRNSGQDTVFRPGAPTAQQSPTQPQAQRRAPKRGKAANVETGQLAENIPRAMRVGKTVRCEVRIAKASVKSLTEGIEGGGQVWQHPIAATKAMSVRVRAPEGGFFIESASPETQWIESNLGYASDDFASWRFLITPQFRGWSDLQIIVSARSIGADGVAAETALPDQIIEVKVRANIWRSLVRIFSWTIAAVIGGALATFGESGMTIVTTLMKKFGH